MKVEKIEIEEHDRFLTSATYYAETVFLFRNDHFISIMDAYDIDNHDSTKNHDPLEFTHFYLPETWDQRFDASCHWEEHDDAGELMNTIMFFKGDKWVEWSNLVHDH